MATRFAQVGDIEALVTLRLDFFKESPDWVMSEKQLEDITAQLYRYYETHLNRDFFAALAVEGEEIAAVSFLVLQEKPANINFPTGKTGIILNVLTYPAYRRKGYASATLMMLIEKARQEHASYLELHATKAGKAVYKKLGFTNTDLGTRTAMRLRLIDK